MLDDLVPSDEQACRHVTAADSWEWLSITLAMVGVPYIVESPPELVEHTRELAARVAVAVPRSSR